MADNVLTISRIARVLARCFVFVILAMTNHVAWSQQDIVTVGGDAVDVRGSVSYSVGQVAVDVDYSGSAIIAQGVQQTTCFPASELVALQACDSLSWRGKRFHISVDTLFEGHSQYGCDSTVHLVLSVNLSSSSDLYEQASGSFLWYDTTLFSTGIYQRHQLNTVGCDSVVNLHLTLIANKPLPTIMVFEDQMLMLNHYPDGEDGSRVDYDAYRWLRNGVVIPNATSDRYGVLEGNHYATLNGCYTLEVPTDASLTAYVQSNTICINSLDVDEALPLSLNLYPNPANGGSYCTLQAVGAQIQSADVVLVNAFGSEVLRFNFDGDYTTFKAPSTAGLYSLLFFVPGQPMMVRKLIVR